MHPKSQVLNRTEMVPRGPSFGIGSAHAQNAPANRKNRPPHPRSRLHSAPFPRTRAIAIRRPSNSRYACSSATKSPQIHAAQCVALHRLRVDACSNEERAVRELALILFQRHEESTNDCVAATLVSTKSVPSSDSH